MFSKFWVHAWSQCGGSKEGHSISVHWVPNSSRRSLWAMKAGFAFSWGHVAYAFTIIRLDTFFSNHQCENIHPEAAYALSWGQVHCALQIVGFDTFFLNHQCKNFHAKRPQLSHHNPPNQQFGRRNFQVQARSEQCTKTHIQQPRPISFHMRCNQGREEIE